MPPDYREPTEVKTMQCFGLKVEAGDQGIVEHMITVFGVMDQGSPPDISHPGCFKKTLKERGDRVKVLNAHQSYSLDNVIAIPLEVKEIGRSQLPTETKAEYPEATGGLWARTQFLLETPQGLNAFSLLKSGAIKEFSFGFDTIEADEEKKVVDGKKITIRNLRELRLWEYSPVLWGKNQATGVIDVKAEDPPCDPNDEIKLLDRVALAPSDLEEWYLPDEVRAVWTREYLYLLPDSAFMFIEEGGEKDKTEKTEPRYLRHLAIRDANGKLDLPHVRNAIQHAPRIKLQDNTIILGAAFKALQEEALQILAENPEPTEDKPVDVTANTIRIRAKGAGTCKKGTYRTITLGKASKGIKAMICRLKGKTTTSIQTYIFAKDKWTLARARAWVKKHSSKSVNLTKLLGDVREAFYETFSGDYGVYGYYVNEVYDDYLVAYEYTKFGGKKYYKIAYTVEKDSIDFASKDDWVEGEYIFQTIEEKGDAPGDQAASTGAGEAATRRADLLVKQIEWEVIDLAASLAA